MDKQESGEIEIPAILLNDYADRLKTGEKIIIKKLDNGNLDVKSNDEILNKIDKFDKLVKYINEILEFNSYDECGEFNDNKLNWNNL